MENVNLFAVVVDSDAPRRARCIDAARASGYFKRVVGTVTLKELLARMESGEESYDVVFLGKSFPNDAIIPTVKRIKELNEDAACILSLGVDDGGAQSVASAVLLGIDSFLCEPFSVEQLARIADLALQIKKENSRKRNELAVSILIKEAVKIVDFASLNLYKGLSVSRSMRKLRKLNSSLEDLTPEAREVYLEMVVDLFEQASIPLERQVPLSEIKAAKGSRSSDRTTARWEEKGGKLRFTVKK